MRKTGNFKIEDMVEGMMCAWEYKEPAAIVYEYVLPGDKDYKEAQLLWELQPDKWVSICVKRKNTLDGSSLWWDTVKEGTSRWD